MKWVTITLLVGLCGCAGVPLQHSASEYSESYADLTNRQLLLNLARLSRNEPPYFVQLGQITSVYQFSATAGFSPTLVKGSKPVGTGNAFAHLLTLGGTLSASAQESPSYQFVPLTGTNFATAISSPIPKELFYTFFDQGFHADTLARVMLSSVTTAQGTYVNVPYDHSYPMFLAYCKWLRDAQQSHYLVLRQVPAANSIVFHDVKLPDAIAAVTAGWKVSSDNNAAATTTTCTLSPPSEWKLEINPKWKGTNFLLVASEKLGRNEFATGADLSFASLFDTSTLTMHTFEAAMYSAAKEQRYFKDLSRTNWVYYPTHARMEFTDRSNDVSATVIASDVLTNNLENVRPIITLTYTPDQRDLLDKLIDVEYNHTTYTIGDVDSADPLKQTYNRSVFSLISYLYTTVGIDPRQLPVQQFIQVP